MSLSNPLAMASSRTVILSTTLAVVDTILPRSDSDREGCCRGLVRDWL